MIQTSPCTECQHALWPVIFLSTFNDLTVLQMHLLPRTLHGAQPGLWLNKRLLLPGHHNRLPTTQHGQQPGLRLGKRLLLPGHNTQLLTTRHGPQPA